jgi:SAM-dependent methyltransferase
MWAGGDYDRIAEKFADVHDRLVAALEPRPGERWLDLATGTGAVATRAARAGAVVTALDLSEGLLERARKHADRAGVEIAFELGDMRATPFPDGAFDVASCSFGVMFPPDPPSVAAELARVCRAGGRLGLTTWRPVPAIAEIYARFAREHVAEFEAWGSERGVRELLGNDFELDVEEPVWVFEGESPEALWEFNSTAAPPAKAFLDTLDEAGRAAYRDAMLDYWRGFVEADGMVRDRRGYLLVLGRRR